MGDIAEIIQGKIKALVERKIIEEGKSIENKNIPVIISRDKQQLRDITRFTAIT